MNYLIGLALGLWLAVIPGAVVFLVLWSVRRDKAWGAERAEKVATDEPTPIYDQLVCESIEREEGWA